MPTPPTGTVTFLFTDIEGSTARWERDPAAMSRDLQRHNQLVRRAIETHDGYVFKTVGDAFHAAFADPVDGLSAAIDAQRALAAEAWTTGDGTSAPLAVRMALHCGVAERRDGDYFGPVLNRAARLLAAGHGGQVLVSDAAEVILGANQLPGVSLRDLGAFRLKDLSRSAHIFQAVAEDLASEFPRLRTLETRPHNLPTPLTSFVGRRRELRALAERLRQARLVTLTGAGGIGKTRLAQQVAAEAVDDFPDGVWWVDLATVADPLAVPGAIRAVLGLSEQPGQTVEEMLAEHCRRRVLLLVLDNCEHLAEACAVLAEHLLTASGGLRVLATSREVLGITGEARWAVPPLAVPDKLPEAGDGWAELQSSEAVDLFVQRASDLRPGFRLTAGNAAAIGAICRQLDGLPLALELAASKVKVLSPEAVLARLDAQLRLLRGNHRGAPDRQQTLEASMAWSHDLLSAAERRLFRRLAVFRGGWTLEAAEAVGAPGEASDGEGGAEDGPKPGADDATISPAAPAGALPDGPAANGAGDANASVLDLLEQLVDKSLVTMDLVDDESRFRYLETVRQYAWEQLVRAGELGGMRRRHALWYRSLAERAEPGLAGAEQPNWLARLAPEHDNLRAAIDWSLAAGGQAELGMTLVGSIWRYWYLRGHWSEGRRLAGMVLARAPAGDRSALAKVQTGAGLFAVRQCDYGAARDLLEASLATWRQLGDRRGVAAAHNYLALVADYEGNYTRARQQYEEALAIRRLLGDRLDIASSLNNIALVARSQGDYAAAERLLAECLQVMRDLGHEHGVAAALHNLGNVAADQAQVDRAQALDEESLVIRQRLGNRYGIALSLNSLGSLAARRADLAAARDLLSQSLAIWQEIGDRHGRATSLDNLGHVCLADGDLAAAQDRFSQALAIRRELGDAHGLVTSLESMARLAVRAKRPGPASHLYAAAAALRERIGVPISPADDERHSPELAAARAALGEAEFAAAQREGAAMTAEDAVSFALELQLDVAG